MTAPGLPWVASPGEALKGAPPLWQKLSLGEWILWTGPAEKADPEAMAAAGWLEVVDADGRSR